jgi:hypothetical protein
MGETKNCVDIRPSEGFVRTYRSDDRIDLADNARRKRRPVSPGDQYLIIAAPDRANLALHKVALVGLRIDHPDPARRHENVIDVAARSRDEPIVKCNSAISDLACNVRRKPALTLASLTPTRRGVTVRHLAGDLRSVIAVLAPNLLDLASSSPLAFFRSRPTSIP